MVIARVKREESEEFEKQTPTQARILVDITEPGFFLDFAGINPSHGLSYSNISAAWK